MEIKAYCNKNNKVMNIFFESEINNIPPEKIKKNELKECKNLEKLLKKYINGKEVNFKKYYDLNLLNITEFEKKVYKETLKIPRGKLKTYKEIGENINSKGYRAIGNALNKNPIPIIIPCHRVIGSNKKLTGFRGELTMKKKLLEKEGLKIKNEKVII